MGSELMPCPFCNRQPDETITEWKGQRVAYCVPCFTGQYSISEWNIRPIEESLRARAEAAEQRAEAAEADVVRLQTERAWAQVDACIMLALAWAFDAPGLIGTCSANGMSAVEIVALRGLCERTIAADRPGDLTPAILRALHNEGTAVRGSAACVAAVVVGLPATAPEPCPS